MFLTLALLCCALFAQSSEHPPAFEVASFRRIPPALPRGGLIQTITPTGLTLRNATLGNCIQIAFGYKNFTTIGPSWRDRPTDVVYDITAKTAAPVPESKILLMLQALLRERLRLAFHVEQRELPVYAMTVARNGPKFRPSEKTGDPSITSAGFYAEKFERVSMARFATTLDPPFTSRHVLDETGLTGVFDFTLDLARYVTNPVTNKPILDARGGIDNENALLQALPQQLGLHLERKSAALEVMVIDSVEKEPAAN